MTPKIDTGFMPLEREFRKFQQKVKDSGASDKGAFVIERSDGARNRYELLLFKEGTRDEENYLFAERFIKSALWVAGGARVYTALGKYCFMRLSKEYAADGKRSFDYNFMSDIYETKFEIIDCGYDKLPEANELPKKIGGQLKGCRIGFDAGGSDRKVSAVIDGEAVYSEEVVWNPKLESDPAYHLDGILDSLKRAASKMPRVDAIGVSSAGIYIDDRCMAASLFVKVPKDEFEKHCKDIYLNAAKALGGVPVTVANDGDVTALAGAMEFGVNNILGIAMGTSQAAGYINGEGSVNGYLSELAFVPVDISKDAATDEWSGDCGVGVKYFSQDAVAKLAAMAGYTFSPTLTPAEKLKEVQAMLERNDALAINVFSDIGTYLGYAIAWYARFYKIENLMLLGRVSSGRASELITANAKKVLDDEFPEFSGIKFLFPDEKNKRVGQSIAAASLPVI